MRAAGVDVPVQTVHLGYMGVLEFFRVMQPVITQFRRSQDLVRTMRPDVVVLVDNETVTLPFAMWLRRRRVPAVFFFPPHVWLWGRWRLPAIVPFAHRFISAFREEADLYRAAGADGVWVGHPLRETLPLEEDRAALRGVGLDPARPLVVLMPGSRRAEIRMLVPPILGAARRLQERDPTLQFAVPLANESLRGEIEHGFRRSGVRDVTMYRPDSYAILSCARVVIQCSGTATLEAALLGIPAVIVYRCRTIEYFVGHYLLINAEFLGMVNILLKEEVQPEFFQKHVDAEHIADEAWSLLTDEPRRRAIQDRLAEIPELLGPAGVFSRAAEAVLELLPPVTNSAQTSARPVSQE